MTTFRLISTTVFCASVLALSACGGEDATTNDAAATPAASASAAASVPAPAESSAPAASAASDKEICEAAKTAGAALKSTMLAAMTGQAELSDADLVALYTSSVGPLEPLVAGGTSAVAKAAQTVTEQAKQAAASADPMAAVSSPEWEKAATELDTACQSAGLDINFA